MNDNVEDKILSRIRKMLALANNSAATEGERDNAMRMAHTLMAKYNVELAQLEEQGKLTDEPREKSVDEFYGRPWARIVCGAMAKLFFCSYIYTPNSDARKIRHHFVGRRSNAITAMEMSRYLVESVRKQAKSEARELFAGNEYVRSFCTGASMTIYERVRELIEESTRPAQAASTGTSLVLANHYLIESEKNEELMARLFPDSKTPSGTGMKRSFSSMGLARGEQYGSTVSLNRQISGGGDKPKLK